MHLLPPLLAAVLNIFAAFVSLLILLTLIAVVVLYVVDRRQHKDAIRHNFPVVGRFRALFSYLASSSANTSSRWTVRKCRSTEQSETGWTTPQRQKATPWPSDQPKT